MSSILLGAIRGWTKQRARLDQEIARLEAAGHSPEAIQEALTSKKHPLHKDSELKQSLRMERLRVITMPARHER
ncbi:MAG: hypothetical protein R3D26_10730 [Cyanobacteriota/Melainabacteria group bacterium]